MKKHRIIILEGLPGVGKSTITKSIVNFDPNIVPVNEIINEEIFDNINLFQEMYFKNDNMKVQKALDSKKAIIDRGPISTFSYNQVRSILDKNFNCPIKDAFAWFETFKDFLASDEVIVFYLTNNGSSYYIPYDNNLDPYGSIENQVLLEHIALYNCKKYCKNLVIIDYRKNNMEELINEIINKHLCS